MDEGMEVYMFVCMHSVWGVRHRTSGSRVLHSSTVGTHTYTYRLP